MLFKAFGQLLQQCPQLQLLLSRQGRHQTLVSSLGRFLRLLEEFPITVAPQVLAHERFMGFGG